MEETLIYRSSYMIIFKTIHQSITHHHISYAGSQETELYPSFTWAKAWYIGVSTQPNVHVYVLWEEAGVHRENLLAVKC